MKRITISLDEELMAMARAHAAATHVSVSRAINDLLKRAVSSGGSDSSAATSPVTGLRVSRGDRRVSTKDVRQALDDEDAPFIDRAGAEA